MKQRIGEAQQKKWREGILPHLKAAESAAVEMTSVDWVAVSTECPTMAHGLSHALGTRVGTEVRAMAVMEGVPWIFLPIQVAEEVPWVYL